MISMLPKTNIAFLPFIPWPSVSISSETREESWYQILWHHFAMPKNSYEDL